MSLRILGIGSPAGDDQAGWLVIDALAARGVPPDVTVEKLDRPGAALIERWMGSEHVVLVDAMQSGAVPGSVCHFRDGAWGGYRGGLSSHGFGVFDALALAQALNSLPTRLELYGIEIAAAQPGELPSPAVVAATRRLAAELAAQGGFPD